MDIHKIIDNITIEERVKTRIEEVEKQFNELINKLNEKERDYVKSYLNVFIDRESHISHRLPVEGEIYENYFCDISVGQTTLEIMLLELSKNKNELCCEQIKKSHEKLTNLEYEECFCGKFRDNQVYVGVHGQKPSLIPPSHEKVEGCMQQIVDMFNNDEIKTLKDHPFLKSSLIHYFTVYVHPFYNGNGRTARLLQHAYLAKTLDLKPILNNDQPLILMSDVFDYYKKKYSDIENVIHKDLSNNQAWNDWFLFNLDIISNHLKRVEYYIEPTYDMYFNAMFQQKNEKDVITM